MQYDNTNRGAIFAPHPNQTLRGQGRVNVNGTDYQAVLVMEPVKRDGEPIPVLYLRAGPAFANDKKGNEKSPDRSGPMDTHPGMRFAMWKKRTNEGKDYLSVSLSAREQQGGHGGQGGYGGQPQGQGQPQGYHGNQPPQSAPQNGYGSGYDDEIPF